MLASRAAGLSPRLTLAVIVAIAAASAVSLPAPALAAGFMVNEQGARASGRANAVVATVADPSAAFHNPGGLGFSKGWSLSLGGSVISPTSEYEDLDGNLYGTESGWSIVPSLFASGALTEAITAGFAFTSPFGSSIEWPDGTPGSDILRSQSLRTFFITPSIAFNLSEWIPDLSLGLGVDFVPATYELERDVIFGEDVGDVQLGGEAFGAGGRVGVAYRPDFLPGLSLGLAWRSEIHLGFSGYADFDAEAPFRAALPADGTISTTLILPQSLLVGVAYTLGPVELEVDVNYVNWSRQPEIEIRSPGEETIVQERLWRDTVGVRIGGEIFLYQVDLSVRAGYAFDPTPIPNRTVDISLPDVDRHVFTCGATYYLPHNVFATAGLLYVLPGERKTKDKPLQPLLKGKYHLSALAASLSIGFTFGADPRPEPRVMYIPFLTDPGGPLAQ